MKPARTVARIWWKVRAPAMTAIEVRYTTFWMGETYTESVSRSTKGQSGWAYN